MVADTCLVCALKPVTASYGFKNIATNSAKTAHYAPGQWSLGCYYGSLKQCCRRPCLEMAARIRSKEELIFHGRKVVG